MDKNYDCSVKESSLSPPEGIHTSIHLSPATEGNKTLSTQLYSARFTRQEKRKDSKGMQGYLARGLLHLQEALLNVRPYIQFY